MHPLVVFLIVIAVLFVGAVAFVLIRAIIGSLKVEWKPALLVLGMISGFGFGSLLWFYNKEWGVVVFLLGPGCLLGWIGLTLKNR